MTVAGPRTSRTRSAAAERPQAVPGDTVGGDSLMQQVAAGDQEAFETLYQRLAPGVFHLVLCIVGDRAKAEGITRSVFQALWRRAPAFDTSNGTVRAWAMSMAYRHALEATRHEPATVGTAGAAPVAPPDDVVADDAGLGLDPTTDAQRRAIALTYYGGFRPDEAADLLGLPTSTVTAQIRDGLRLLGGGAARSA